MYLYILVSLVLALIFAFSCHTAIRRHPGIFYGIAFFLVLSEVIYYQFGIHDIAPQWFTAYIVNPFKRGAFSTALFMHKKGLLQNAVFRPKRKIYLLKKLARTTNLTVLANFFSDIIFENSILQQALLLFFPLYKTDFSSGYFSAVPPPWWPFPAGWDLTWVWRW